MGSVGAGSCREAMKWEVAGGVLGREAKLCIRDENEK